jgi:RNA polymerase sigma factor (sigma-70 family)
VASADGTRRRPKSGDGKDVDLVRLYLNDIGRYPLLTKEDEVRLAQTIEAGREATAILDSEATLSPDQRRKLHRSEREANVARQSFVLSNLRLVVAVAKRYQASGLPLLDLAQEGNLGLIHAVEKFDWRRGFKFSTYATWWIRQAINRGISNTARTIRVPVHAADQLTTLQQAFGLLEGSLGRSPTQTELADALGIPLERLRELLAYRLDPLSLSQPLGTDGEAELGDLVEDAGAATPFEHALKSVLPEEVARLLAPLSEREAKIIQLRFGLDEGEPQTLEQIGERFNLTRERIRQLEAKAMTRLRHPSTDRGARELLRD